MTTRGVQRPAVPSGGRPAVQSGGRPAGKAREPGRAGRMLRRALLLRCPQCGARGIRKNWFEFEPRCPGCNMMLDRGENDFFIGAYLVNLIVAELIAAGFIAAAVAALWPDVPWTWVTRVGVVLMIASPLFFFPFSRMAWLAIDLTFQPPTPADFGERLTPPRPKPDTPAS
jgi:uncharacterized protein (DUF983 family)